jgi:phage terminase small subunit
VTADQVVTELALIAFSDMGNYVQLGEDGRVHFDWSEMPDDGTRVISEITQEVTVEGRGDDAENVRKTKFKLFDKLGALTALGKHFGIFIERRELSAPGGGPIQIEDVSTCDAKERHERTEALLDRGRARRTERARSG